MATTKSRGTKAKRAARAKATANPKRSKAPSDRNAARRSATRKTSSKKEASPATASLHLDAAIYTLAALRRAISAFSDLAQIEVRKVGQKQLVSFARMSPDMAGKLPDEFANYALGCLVTQR